MNKRRAVLLCTAVITSLLGCSNVTSQGTGYNFTGVWFGALLGCAGHCFNQPEISFTLFQQPTAIRGFYRCWIGRDDCPYPDSGGKVTIPNPESAVVSIQVLMHDGSRCLFQGSAEGDEIAGDRVCYTSRGSIRTELWYMRRAY